jgi:hypothetical protein
MCSRRDGKSMIAYTGSSNTGQGICCKPDSKSKACTTNKDYICSQPAAKANTITKFIPIVKNVTNNQMFAFCPITKKAIKACGPSKLVANATALNFTRLPESGDFTPRYENNLENVANRSYDACYYEISSVPK